MNFLAVPLSKFFKSIFPRLFKFHLLCTIRGTKLLFLPKNCYVLARVFGVYVCLSLLSVSVCCHIRSKD